MSFLRRVPSLRTALGRESLSDNPPGLRPAAEAHRTVAADLAGTEPATVLGSSRCTSSLGLGPRADHCSGSARIRSTALLLGALLVVGTVLGVAPGATAAVNDDVRAADAAWSAGNATEAHRLLLDWALTDPTDAESILEAVEIATEMKDADLVERLQGLAESAARGGSSALLDVARASASLGLAEARLARQETSSSIAFLFADAEEQAGRATSPEVAAAGRRLRARSRWAQGDLDGALSILEETGWGTPDARHHALHGRLLYERATSRGLDGNGYATEKGAKDLSVARDRLVEALAPGGNLRRRERAEALVTRAWTAHRRGELDDARAAYLEARRIDPASELPIRGLVSLYQGRPAELVRALTDLVNRSPSDRGAWEALVRADRAAGDPAAALVAAQRRIALAEREPAGWVLAGDVLAGIRQWTEAERHYAKALEIDPESAGAASGLESVAIETFKRDPDAGLGVYDRLLALRPKDPFVRNNLGFLLREAVSPWTDHTEKRTQVLKPDAPSRIHDLLGKCAKVYLDAVALIPESEDGQREEMEEWNLAGIVNDAGLILHYFEDAQDLPRAEALYWRAFRMTHGTFKDTYSPNFQWLYGLVMEGKELDWYRAARMAKDAIRREVMDASGAVTALVADEPKRQAAARDERALRERILRTLQEDAEADGEPWPPTDGGATVR